MRKQRVRSVTPMTQAELQAWVIGCAHDKGWLAQVTRDAQYGSPGVLLVKFPRVIFAECRVHHLQRNHALTAPQRKWLGTLDNCGFETYEWWPSDKPQIAEILSAPLDVIPALLEMLPINDGDILATNNGISKAFERIGLGRSA